MVWHVCEVHVSEKRCNQKGVTKKVSKTEFKVVTKKGTKKVVTKNQVKRKKRETMLPPRFDLGNEHSQIKRTGLQCHALHTKFNHVAI